MRLGGGKVVAELKTNLLGFHGKSLESESVLVVMTYMVTIMMTMMYMMIPSLTKFGWWILKRIVMIKNMQ